MKKLSILALAAILIFCLCACVRSNAPEVTTVPTTVPATVPTTVPVTEPAAVLLPGYYLLDSDADDLGLSTLRMYILINADHTGVIGAMGMKQELTWNDTQLIMDGEPAEYKIEGDLLIILPNTVDQLSLRYHGDVLPEEYLAPALTSGYFVLSSVGNGGDITFHNLNPENGYLKLNEDGTGVLFYDGTESELTWDASNLYLQDTTYSYIYYSSEMTGDEPMLMMLIYETQTTVAFRPMEEPAN